MDRAEREKQFHNQEFEEHKRETLHWVYRVAAPAIDNFIESVTESARGKRVLEIGCGPGSVSLRVAAVAERLTAIDISDTAVRQASERAARARLSNAEFHVMNAEELAFEAGSFDFICGRSILHHLDLNRAYPAIARVLRPSGVAVFLEPLGHNPLVNAFRHKTPDLRTPDEHPLMRSDLRLALRYFGRVQVRPRILASLGAALLPDGVLFRGAYAACSAADRLLLAVPGLRWWAWTSVWRFEQPRRPA